MDHSLACGNIIAAASRNGVQIWKASGSHSGEQSNDTCEWQIRRSWNVSVHSTVSVGREWPPTAVSTTVLYDEINRKDDLTTDYVT